MVEPNMNNNYNSNEISFKENDNEAESIAQLERIERGGRMVKGIAITYLAVQFIGFLSSQNFIALFLGIGIATGLMMGKNWVRLLYVVFAVIGIVVILINVVPIVAFITIPTRLLLWGLFSVGLNITFIVLLTANQSILAFFESQKRTYHK